MYDVCFAEGSWLRGRAGRGFLSLGGGVYRGPQAIAGGYRRTERASQAPNSPSPPCRENYVCLVVVYVRSPNTACFAALLELHHLH